MANIKKNLFVSFDSWADRLAQIKPLQEHREALKEFSGTENFVRDINEQIKEKLRIFSKLNNILYFYHKKFRGNLNVVVNSFLNHKYVKISDLSYAKLLVNNYEKRYTDIVKNIELNLELQNYYNKKQFIINNKLRKFYENNNVYSYLEVFPCEEKEIVEIEEEQQDNCPVIKYKNIIKHKVKFIFSSKLGINYNNFNYIKYRSIVLLYKLQSIIRNFRINRLPKIFKLNFVNNSNSEEFIPLIQNRPLSSEIATFQMDAHGIDNVQEETAGNVVLTETPGESVAVADEKMAQWVDYTSSDVVGSYKEMTDRWLEFKDFIWQKNRSQSLLLSLDLPKDIIVNNKFKICDVPNLLPFRVHRYWSGDIEIKIQINSNKFQIGQLMCCWWYQTELDHNFSLRSNVYSGSQTNHVLISAGASNEATLIIPYKHHMPMIHTSPRVDTTSYLTLGKLLIFILNPLSVSTTGPSACYGSIFGRFKNCKFTGQISGTNNSIAQFQMERLLEGAAMGALSGLCANLDNPQDTRNSQYVVPIASHSWSYGTGISEPLQSLRLNPNGLTQHPDNNSSETLIKDICNKYGLLTTIQWSKNDAKGTLLFSCDAAPLLNVRSYEFIKDFSVNELKSYYIPPVGVVSSLFNYWRGNLSFRFDIVSSIFHTGRLLVGYVPGATDKDVVTINTILSGPHMVFTLQQDQQFVYEIPYISDRPFWSRKYTGNYQEDQVLAPSKIYIFVLNPLIPMESVFDKVFINIYMKGSDSFEVAIPVQPSLGLGWNRKVLYSDSEIIYSLNSSIYCGVWHSFASSERLVYRHLTTSEGVATFDFKFLKQSSLDTVNKKVTSYYYKLIDYAKGCSTLYGKYDTKSKSYIDTVMVPVYSSVIWGDDSKTYAVMIPHESQEKAAKFSRDYINNNFVVTDVMLQSCMHVGSTTTGNQWSKGNPGWVAQIQVMSSIEADLEDAVYQGEREEASNKILTGSSLSSTNGGASFYGETFKDLKDLMRRYQTYAQFPITPKNQTQIGQVSAVVPLVPQGLELEIGSASSINEFSNRCREGHIPIILSGFRYYRGSLRVRLMFPTKSEMLGWVQHRPDRKLTNSHVHICSAVDSGNCLGNHTYAAFIQDCGVNSIIQLEVPFYKNCAYNLLQDPIITEKDEGFYFSLGELAIGAFYSSVNVNNISKEYPVTMYYCVADDFNCSTFQGFPPMILCDDIKTQSSAKFQIGNPIKWFASSAVEGVKPQVETLIEENVNKITTSMNDTLSDFKNYIGKSSFSNILESSIFRTILSQLAHVWANFNLKSVCIALATILIEIGLFTIELTKSLIETIRKFMITLNNKYGKTSGKQPNPPDIPTSLNPFEDPEIAEEAVYNMAGSETMESDGIVGLITVLWTAMCSVFALKSRNLSSMDGFCKLITKDMSGVFRSSNGLFILLRNLFSVLDGMKYRIMGFVSPSYRQVKYLTESHADIKTWCEEVIELDNPSKFYKEKFLQKYKARVHIAFTKGQLLYGNIADIQDNKVSRVITDMYVKIRSLREKMLEFGDDSFTRLEPFVMWQYGQPGLGKSHFTHDISMELLKCRREIVNVPPIYVHESSSDFWDSCVGNPVMVIDDIFNVQEGEILAKHLGLLFSVVSPVILTPPKARLEDKGRPYNPKIVVINSNYDFIKLNNVNTQAIHRRRNVLIKFSVNMDFKAPGCCFHCDSLRGKTIDEINNLISSVLDKTHSSLLVDYHHLKFQLANNVLDENAGWSDFMTYKELVEFLKVEYVRVMNKNEEKYRARAEEVMSLMNFDDTLDDSSFSNLEANAAKVIKEQDSIINQMYNRSIVGSFKSMFGSFKSINQDLYTKACLYSLNLIDKKRCKGLLSEEFKNKALNIKIAIPASSGNLTVSDYLDFSDESINFQGDDATSVYAYHHFEILDELERLCNGQATQNLNDEMLDDISSMLVMRDMDMNIESFLLFKLLVSKGEPHPFNKFHVVSEINGYDKGKYRMLYGRRFSWEKFFAIVYDCMDSTNLAMFLNVKDLDSVFLYTSVRCMHYQCIHDLPNVTYDSDNECFRYRGKLFDCTCTLSDNKTENQACLWYYMPYKYYFYSKFLDYNIKYQKYYKLKTNIKITPRAFRPLGVVPDEICDMSIFQQVMENLKDKYEKCVLASSRISGCVWKILKYAGIVFGMYCSLYLISVGSMYACDKALGVVCPKMTAEAMWKDMSSPQSPSYSQNINVNLNSKVPVAKPQAADESFDICIKRIRTNNFQITAYYDDKIISCCGLVLEGRTLLLLRHFKEEFDVLPPTTTYYGSFHLRNSSFVPLSIDFRELKFKSYDFILENGMYGSNYIVTELPLKFCSCKSIIPFIASSKEHQNMRGDAILFQNNGIIHENLNVVREKTRPIIISGLDNSTNISLQDMYTYRMQGRGMCGSILLVRGVQRPIIGMHVAGVEKGNIRGIAEPLVLETFKSITKEDPNYVESIIPILNDEELAIVKLDPSLISFGCVSKERAAYQSKVTSIIPSMIHGVFEVNMHPGPLSSSDARLPHGSKPLEDGIAHMGKCPKDFSKEDLYHAAEDYKETILNAVIPLRKVGLLSYQDAVCGIKNLKGYEPLEWSTSPGYPLRFDKDSSDQSGKKWLFDLEERQDDVFKLKGFHPKLKKLLMLDSNLRERNIKPFTLFVDCLKDHCMPDEKCCIPGKTRIFSISPVQFTIEFKRYFTDFTAAFQESRLKANHGIGIDVNSVEWTDLTSLLLSKGDKFICGDYKNFGPGLMLKAAESAFEIILAWYSFHGDGNNNRIRRIMVQEILGAFHLGYDNVYTCPCGIPSGSPITTPLNSIVGALYIRVCWRRITNLSFREMRENTYHCIVGDDIIMSVSDKYIEKFNTITINEFLNYYNIVFTDSDKTGNLVPFRTLFDATFLKCGFKPHPIRRGLWLAPLDKRSVENCPNWIVKKNNKVLATQQNCEQTLELAHGHGKEYYDFIKSKLILAMRAINLEFRVDSWEDVDFRRYQQ